MVNWKTTAAGVLGAISLWLYNYLQNGTIDKNALIIGCAIAGLGALAKDFNVTHASDNISTTPHVG